ncbi:MAG: phosphodiester glycosidase family protein [Sandaracinaceae bacterium]|nr:phosphodiester glycosidase family protein [Sandaracinaceae bacterium]
MRRLLAGLAFALWLPLVAVRAQPSASVEGLVVERVRLPRAPEVAAGNRVLTVVRVDLSRYRLAVLSAVRDGAPRTLDAWVRDHRLAGGINAGMFLPSYRPVGTLLDRGEALSLRNPARYDGIVGWDPRPGASAIAVGGRGCPTSREGLLERYQSAVQGFRMMIDCAGRARPWPTRRRYSAAALGRDAEGRAVFVHTRTPYRMEVLNQMMVELDLGIRGLVYMEGGPEASLVVREGATRVTEIGSWEDGFWENDGNDRLWDIPGVIGFTRR